MSSDRQTIMETNRSLRTIKNELENLLEKGVIDDETYENIHSILPAEQPLRGGARAPAPAAPTPTPPTDAMSNMSIENQRGTSSPAPPTYNQSTGGGAAPPPGPPPPPAGKPVIAHARALYRYNAADSRDLSFERDDKIQVHEYMNSDWWMGRNTRTGAEGIFPKTYVAIDHADPPQQQRAAAAGYGPPQGQPGYGQPGYHNQPPVQQLWPPPAGQQQQHQYNPPGPPPPQQQQQQQQENNEEKKEDGEEKKDGAGKAKEYGEKFGKKLGNAAIFGAGATLGSNLVNSIF